MVDGETNCLFNHKIKSKYSCAYPCPYRFQGQFPRWLCVTNHLVCQVNHQVSHLTVMYTFLLPVVHFDHLMIIIKKRSHNSTADEEPVYCLLAASPLSVAHVHTSRKWPARTHARTHAHIDLVVPG